MDGRVNNKGKIGNKGGRPSKAAEQQLIEKLTPFEDEALKALRSAVKEGQSWAVKMYFEYRYGKPKESKDITTNGESINIPVFDFFDQVS